MPSMPAPRATDAPSADFETEARHLHDRLARSFTLVGRLRSLTGTLVRGFHLDEVAEGIETLREQIESLEDDLEALAGSDEAETLASALEELATLAEDAAGQSDGPRAWAELHAVVENCRVRVAAAMSAAERNRLAWAEVRMRLSEGLDAVSAISPEQVQKLQRALSTPLSRMSAVMQARDAIDQRLEHIGTGLSLGQDCDEEWRACAGYFLAAQMDGLAETLGGVRESAQKESAGVRKAISQHWEEASGGLEDLAEVISDIALLGPARAATTLEEVRQVHPRLEQAIEQLHAEEKSAGSKNGLPDCAGAASAAFPPFLDEPCRKVMASLASLSTAAVEFQRGLGTSDPVGQIRWVLQDLDRDIGRLERSADALREIARTVGPDDVPPLVDDAAGAVQDLYTVEEERTAHAAALARISEQQ